MKHPWTAYVIVALLAVGAGVAVAGLPDNSPVAATVVPATTTEASTIDVPDTTDAPATTDVPDTTDSPETTEPDTTEPEASVPETTEPGGTDPDTTEPAELPDRADIVVAVANGAGIAGAAARNVERLATLGYEDLSQHDGTEIVEFTVIYFAPGFDGAAARMAEEYDLFPEFVAPLADAPEVVDLPDDTELLAYIGIDRA